MARKLKKNEVILREHTYDGIQEYDQPMPNWWLVILFGTLIFCFVYWFYYFQSGVGLTDEERLERRMAEIQAIRLESSIDVENDDLFWEMRDSPAFVSAGAAVYATNCVSCHGADLKGGIGNNLIDNQWRHGHRPSEIYRVIEKGVLERGMPAHENLLGQTRIAQAVAYILSYYPDRATMEAEAVHLD